MKESRRRTPETLSKEPVQYDRIKKRPGPWTGLRTGRFDHDDVLHCTPPFPHRTAVASWLRRQNTALPATFVIGPGRKRRHRNGNTKSPYRSAPPVRWDGWRSPETSPANASHQSQGVGPSDGWATGRGPDRSSTFVCLTAGGAMISDEP